VFCKRGKKWSHVIVEDDTYGDPKTFWEKAKFESNDASKELVRRWCESYEYLERKISDARREKEWRPIYYDKLDIPPDAGVVTLTPEQLINRIYWSYDFLMSPRNGND